MAKKKNLPRGTASGEEWKVLRRKKTWRSKASLVLISAKVKGDIDDMDEDSSIG